MSRSAVLRAIASVMFAAVTFVAATAASAQDWPRKPVRIVLPFAAGGASDVLGRVIARELNRQFNQEFLVENRSGDGGLVGAAAVARAAPDGYTLLLSGMSTHVVSPLTAKTYNPLTDFTNIAFIGGTPAVILVHPSLEVRSLNDLIAMLRRRPEPWRFVSPGVGTLGHLVGEYWAQKGNFGLSHAPYEGANQYLRALVAGDVPIGSVSWLIALGQIRSGALIPLAVSSARRMTDLDSVPTFAELGYPDLVATTWYGLAAPRGLSASITARLNQAIGAVLDDRRVARELASFGLELDKKSPAELSAFIKAEVTKWAPFLRKTAPAKKTAPPGRRA